MAPDRTDETSPSAAPETAAPAAPALRRLGHVGTRLLAAAWHSPLKKYLLYSLAVHVVVVAALSAGTLRRVALEAMGYQVAAPATSGPESSKAGAGTKRAEASPGEADKGKTKEPPPAGPSPETTLEQLLQQSDAR